MQRCDADDADAIRAVIEAYNGCFYRRDLAGLRALYAADGDIVYFDNHAGCDAEALDAHVAAVGAFFATGKETESGGIEPLLVENFRAWAGADAALATAMVRYQSAPRPGVRASFVLERPPDAPARGWLIRHIHYSFDPGESA